MNTKNGSSLFRQNTNLCLEDFVHGVTHPEDLTLNTHHHEYIKTYETEPYSIPVLFFVLIFLQEHGGRYEVELVILKWA
jgi:hypothetical protein